MVTSLAKNVPTPPLPTPHPQSPPPSSLAPSPHRVREKATSSTDAEILGIYGSSAPIHLVNDPPRKRGIVSNGGELTSVVRAKRPDTECVAHAFVLVPQPTLIPTPILETPELSKRMRSCYVCEIVFYTLTSLIIEMHFHP